MFHIGILKIGANITQSKSIKTASNFDIFSLMDPLPSFDFGISIITKVTRNTFIDKRYNVIDIMKFTDNSSLDCLLVFNGAINFYGGAESPELIQNYKVIVNCIKKAIPVYYVMSDCRFPLKQVWPAIQAKEWGSKYNKEDVWIHNCVINYIYQGSDKGKLMKLLAKGKDTVLVTIDRIFTLNIPWAIFLKKRVVYGSELKYRAYDLFYGGANRDTFRAKRFKEFYDISRQSYYPRRVAIAGSIKVTFPINRKLSAIPNESFIRTMAQANTTVIIGDQFYCDNFYTLRIFESILAGCITFIDEYFDTKHKIYAYIKDEKLKAWLYVKNKHELLNKLNELDELSDKRITEIRKVQLSAVKSLSSEYLFINRLIDIVKNKNI